VVTFTDLLSAAKRAFRARDCGAARDATRRLLITARTPKERETVMRLQNAVRRCKVRPLAGPTRSSKRRRRATRRGLGAITVTSDAIADRMEAIKENPEPTRLAAQRIQTIANELAAAGDSFGGKVFISDIARRLDSSVKRLAPILLAANRKGWLSMARADLRGAMDPVKVDASEIRYLNSEVHFVTVPPEMIKDVPAPPDPPPRRAAARPAARRAEAAIEPGSLTRAQLKTLFQIRRSVGDHESAAIVEAALSPNEATDQYGDPLFDAAGVKITRTQAVKQARTIWARNAPRALEWYNVAVSRAVAADVVPAEWTAIADAIHRETPAVDVADMAAREQDARARARGAPGARRRR
jgi:hypothetical protein